MAFAARLSADVREMVAEQFTYRDLLVQMTKRDLLLRYKQTLMGFGWAVFMPLVNTAVFSVIFMRVAPIETKVPYPLFAYCGLSAWNFLSSSLRFAVNSLTSNANLVSKVYFPREIFPVSATLVSLVDFAVSSIVLIALMVYYRVPATSAIAFLPLVVLVHVLFTTGIALLLAMANLFYRDVKYLFEIVVTVWMFATAVLYPVELVSGRLGLIMRFNPMTPIIEGYRATLLYGRSPIDAGFGYAAAIAIAVFSVGWLTFHRAEFEFAENI